MVNGGPDFGIFSFLNLNIKMINTNCSPSDYRWMDGKPLQPWEIVSILSLAILLQYSRLFHRPVI